ncbi:MAG: NAD(P)-binding domain-containing protein [Blastocatellia bacterium]|nr:NAD(P)-binding domain-containing protein [Blastocatellia bacterium]
MGPKSRFIIKRKDKVDQVDDVLVEKESLTIGRLIGNDLVLNHRAVSRTHAGVKESGGVFWLFNLSTSNGTLLNGELVDKTPLADGDLVQIGPYLLRMNYLGDAFSITVEMKIAVDLLEGQARGSGQKHTILFNIPPVAGVREASSRKIERVSGTGYLSILMPAMSQKALEAYWALRLREAGKVDATTPLRPKRDRKVGKIQFNWRPTLDLVKPWRKAYFTWGIMLVAALAVMAAFLYDEAYSPGELSTAHTSPLVSARNIAVRSNEGTCSNCHSTSAKMQVQCNSCHTTAANQTAAGFEASVFDAHNRAGVGCIACHSEHLGQKSEFGLRSALLCSKCHNDDYIIKEGPRAGTRLGEPHGGETGYPVVGGEWTWKGLSAERWKQKNLSQALSDRPPADQFHLLHLRGRMHGRMECADCHTAPVEEKEAFRRSPRAECAKCHGLSKTDEGLEGKDRVNALRLPFERGKRNCYTCHVQHRQSEVTDTLLAGAGDDTKITQYLNRLNVGASDEQGSRGAGEQGSRGARDLSPQHPEPQSASRPPAPLHRIGGLPALGWIAVLALLPVALIAGLTAGTARRRIALRRASALIRPVEEGSTTGSLDLEKLKSEGPSYPHPVIDPVLCIGCHACVEVCPHDVLSIVNGIATPVALDQCMEDTSCQVECPTNPKACVVLNTTKVIPERKVPGRDQELQTRVYGVYLVGDVSGVPLIKNAVNEGAQVINAIVEDLKREGQNPKAEYDVAIVGAGPAGLSAAVTAGRCGLRYVVIEQSKVLATIQAYPAGKELFFKPDNIVARGGIPVPRAGERRENRLKEIVLRSWLDTLTGAGIEIHEEETCREIKREDDLLAVITEKGETREKTVYRASKVVLAIGNRGTPRKLNVAGEDMKITVRPDPNAASLCRRCGGRAQLGARFCPLCGAEIEDVRIAPYQDDKVKYRLSDADHYAGRKVLVVGGGNSAIEAAVALCGLSREGDRITFTRNAEVALAIRSDFKIDLKFGNKMNVYDCIDAGRLKVFYRTEIQEIKETEVVLRDVTTKKEVARIPADYIFAFIGAEKPTRFLQGLGVEIA